MMESYIAAAMNELEPCESAQIDKRHIEWEKKGQNFTSSLLTFSYI
jgi:hypothetical protein